MPPGAIRQSKDALSHLNADASENKEGVEDSAPTPSCFAQLRDFYSLQKLRS
jgi:hypothetical protein